MRLKTLEWMYKSSAFLAGLFLLGLAVTITVDVLKRWIIGAPITGVFEFASITFLIVTFLALGLVQHQGRQMRIDLISNRVRGRAGHVLEGITDLLGLCFLGVLLWQGSEEWVLAYSIGDVRQGRIEIPCLIHLSFLVCGTFLICLSLITGGLSHLWKAFRPGKVSPTVEPGALEE